MLSRKSNLPAVQTSTALAVVTESAAAIVAPGQVPKTVTNGIKGIMLAFPTQGIPDSDRQILQTLYLEGVAGFPRAVVEWTLKYLVFNNPRNTATFTCPPTPQDVREACRRTNAEWQRWVCDFYFDPPYGKRFGLPTNDPKPGEQGCIVPEDLQIAFLMEEIARQIDRIAEKEAQEQRGEIPRCNGSHIEILAMPDDAFECIPEAAFPDGTRDTIKTKRAERAEAKRLAEERARAAEEERRLKIERDRDEIDREIAAIEAENAQAQVAARQELSIRWENVFFVRPHSDTAWHFRQWMASLDRRGRVDLLEKIVMSENGWQLAVPHKSPANDETELPVLVPYKHTDDLRKRRQWL